MFLMAIGLLHIRKAQIRKAHKVGSKHIERRREGHDNQREEGNTYSVRKEGEHIRH
jgi:hypothetical protein